MSHHVCPVWIGYLLASPIRRLFQNPEKILAPYIREGMTIFEVGCAMGFFSLPAARMVGLNGKVVCIDVQAKMIESLESRALKSGLRDRIDTRLCSSDSLGVDDLTEKIDFAFAIAVVHEVPDSSVLFKEICKALKTTGQLLVAEPRAHVSQAALDKSIAIAEQNGLKTIARPMVRSSHAALFEKETQ